MGLGLIGGSLALAASARGDDVSGSDSDPEAGRVGLERGAVGRFDDSLARRARRRRAGVRVRAGGERCRRWTRAVLEAAPEGCVVSDVGSTKGRLVAAVGGEPAVRGRPSGVWL